MKKILLFILLTLITLDGYSQSKKRIYVDENFKKINFLNFDKKIESNLYNVVGLVNDSAIFKKLQLNEIFGKLDSKKKSQLNKLFLNRYKVDSLNTWYIHYRIDELNRINKPNLKYVFTDSLTKEPKEKKIEYFTRRVTSRYVQTNDPDTISYFFNKLSIFELNRIKNPKKTTLLHLDDIKRDSSLTVQGIHNHFYEDYNSIVKTIFNVSFSNNNLIIIHPDGSYYVSKNRSGFNRKELFKYKSFKREEKKWLKKYENYN